MRTMLVIAMLAAAVAVPAAFADASPQAPGAYCVNHKDQIGAGKVYLTIAACVKAQKGLSDQNVVNSAKACLAEQGDSNFAAGHDGKMFDQFYGTNIDNGKGKGNGNALGKCVSSKASAKTAEQQTAQTNAAKKCRTPELRAQTGAAKKYRNFGACVSDQVKHATS